MSIKRVMSKKKFVSLFFVIGFGLPSTLLFLSKFYVDSNIWFKFIGFLVWLFNTGALLGGIIPALNLILAAPISPSVFDNFVFAGLTNGFYYSIFGLLIWKGIYQKKKCLLYLVGIYFLVMVLLGVVGAVNVQKL